MRKKFLLQMFALDYIPSVCKVEALVRKLEQCEIVEDGMFVDGKRKKDKKIIFDLTQRFKLELYLRNITSCS